MNNKNNLIKETDPKLPVWSWALEPKPKLALISQLFFKHFKTSLYNMN